MEIAKARLCGVPMLRVIGDIDHLTSPALLAAAGEVLDPETAHILLDLGGCPYLDSGGMNVLLTILRTVKSRLGWLGVIAPTRDVHRLLEMVGLTMDPDFRVFADMTGTEKQLQAEALGS
jgi:stage II sporulation protein AA (anti-sigma F factor antagonist)